jgi:hypothetical protein
MDVILTPEQRQELLNAYKELATGWHERTVTTQYERFDVYDDKGRWVRNEMCEVSRKVKEKKLKPDKEAMAMLISSAKMAESDGVLPSPAKSPFLPEPLVMCADCGRPIKGHGNFSAEQIKAAAVKQFGVPLCYGCGCLRKNARGKAEALGLEVLTGGSSE